ncbi:TerD family protein [Actinomadura gamaensis]|uniref:TerD family protein n=1 Tax=Actinomadura gamaensis TaxID=1763541 RepID=A0ABV9TUX2_9ACTN
MGVRLAGGDVVPLSGPRSGRAPSALSVGFDWTPPATSRADFELDASALMLDASGAVLSEDHFIYFNNPRSPDGAVEHRGPAADAPGETIDVDLAAVPDRCARIAFPISIFDAANRAQHFGHVGAVSIQITTPSAAIAPQDDASQDDASHDDASQDGAELARFDLPPDPNERERATAVLMGELDRRGDGWTFRAVGRGYPGGLRELVTDHGLPTR